MRSEYFSNLQGLTSLRKWDRKTISALHMTTLVHRRDITSLRDLKKKDAPWLRRVSQKMVSAICEAYPELEQDQLKLYVHCRCTVNLWFRSCN